MTPAARNEYLATDVMTAAPQKLQLLLIEGAIRFARQAEAHWRLHENEVAFSELGRCQEIVTQLIAGLAPNLESPLVRRIAAVYAFVYRTIVSASFHRDASKLADALRVLEIERETWQQVCDQLGSSANAAVAAALTTDRAAIAPLAIDLSPPADATYRSLSFEA
jgi:flagellar protein FliS